jgi:hypothetical protein
MESRFIREKGRDFVRVYSCFVVEVRPPFL